MVDAVPTTEAPPTITMEGAGVDGKITISEAAEPAAIIDTNDGSSTINTGPDLDGVAIIDTNDGTSTVGIIDTNDGAGIVEAAKRIDPASIIDTNDGAGTVREDLVDPAMIIDTNRRNQHRGNHRL